MAPPCCFLALHWEGIGLQPVIRNQFSLYSFMLLLSLLLGLVNRDYSLQRTKHDMEVSSIGLFLVA